MGVVQDMLGILVKAHACRVHEKGKWTSRFGGMSWKLHSMHHTQATWYPCGPDLGVIDMVCGGYATMDGQLNNDCKDKFEVLGGQRFEGQARTRCNNMRDEQVLDVTTRAKSEWPSHGRWGSAARSSLGSVPTQF
jgi:hypothetical protein